jgi:hypothetical protein
MMENGFIFFCRKQNRTDRAGKGAQATRQAIDVNEANL